MPDATARPHVLVVDDEPAVAQVLTRHLERLGYRVTRCTEGAAALAQFGADPAAFDLVVTDFRMPGKDGLQLCHEFSATRPDLPTLVCTGNPDDLPPRDTWPSTLCGLLTKPVCARDLADAVTQALAR